MFTADLLHDETAEIARLSERVTALLAEVETLREENAAHQQQAAGHTVREQVWEWFRTGARTARPPVSGSRGRSATSS